MRFPLLVSRLENRHQLQIVIKGEYDLLIDIGAARDESNRCVGVRFQQTAVSSAYTD